MNVVVVHNQELGARNWDKNKAYKPFRNTFLSLRQLHIYSDRRPLLAPSRTWCPQQSCLHSPSWRILSCRSSRQQSWGRIDMYGYASSILKRCQMLSIYPTCKFPGRLGLCCSLCRRTGSPWACGTSSQSHFELPGWMLSGTFSRRPLHTPEMHTWM